MNDLAVIIPVYKECLTELEEQSIKNTFDKLSGRDFFLIAPQSLNLEWYKTVGRFNIVRFANKYFQSERAYSKLLLKEEFYQAFDNYKNILIVQTDVWIIGNSILLNQFLDMEYDYIGAPWKEGITAFAYTFKGIGYLPTCFSKPQKISVGNGGLSLRNVDKHIKLLRKYRFQSRIWVNVGEDIFFSYYGNQMSGFKIAPVEVAEKFSLETSAREDIARGIVPFGIHAWEKYYSEVINI